MRTISVKDLVIPLALMTAGALVSLCGIVFGLFTAVVWTVPRDAVTFAAIGMAAMILMRTGVHYGIASRGDDGDEWAYAVATAFRDVRFWGPATLFGAVIAVMRHWSLS